MRYKIYNSTNYSKGEPLIPFVKLFESNDFKDITSYIDDNKKENEIWFVLLKNGDILFDTSENIFESPDGIEIYKRHPLSNKRSKINKKNNELNFDAIFEFESKIADFFGAPYAIAVDCCTHGIELCIRYLLERENCKKTLSVPKRTYISIPFLSKKLNLNLEWRDENWKYFYYCFNEKVIDAAVLWKKDSYIPCTFMNISFQFRKHLSLGRGGIILTDNKKAAIELKKMSYDGRLPNIPWRNQDIKSMGYHYYMTPETAKLGLDKLVDAINNEPKQWVYTDWPDLTKMEVFKQKNNIN